MVFKLFKLSNKMCYATVTLPLEIHPRQYLSPMVEGLPEALAEGGDEGKR